MTSFSWLSFSHAVRFARTGGSCGRPVCHSVSEVCSRSVTGAVDTRRLAHRCALRRARESRQSPRQLRRRRSSWLSLRARAFLADLFLYIDIGGLVGRCCTHGYLNFLVSVTYNIFWKYDCFESTWLARNVTNVQLRGALTRCLGGSGSERIELFAVELVLLLRC